MQGLDMSCNKFANSGGAERYILDITAEMHSQNFAIDCYCNSIDRSLQEVSYIKERVLNVGFLPQKLRDLGFDLSLSWARRSRLSRPLLAFNRVRTADVAVCMGTHRGWMASCNRRPSLADREQVNRERLCYQHAEYVVAHSARLASELHNLYDLQENKVVVLYPPVRGERFFPVPDSQRAVLRHRFGFADDEVVLALPSMDHRRKGLDEIRRALDGLDLPMRLVVAGRQAGSRATVTSLGYVKDMENLYRAADFTVLASRYEPFGLAAVESVLCGTPVLVSRCVGSLEVLPAGAVTVCDPADIDDLRNALRQCYANAASRMDLENINIKSLQDALDCKKHVSALLSIVDRVGRMRYARQ